VVVVDVEGADVAGSGAVVAAVLPGSGSAVSSDDEHPSRPAVASSPTATPLIRRVRMAIILASTCDGRVSIARPADPLAVEDYSPRG
jgi:hypothetical protein